MHPLKRWEAQGERSSSLTDTLQKIFGVVGCEMLKPISH